MEEKDSSAKIINKLKEDLAATEEKKASIESKYTTLAKDFEHQVTEITLLKQASKKRKLEMTTLKAEFETQKEELETNKKALKEARTQVLEASDLLARAKEENTRFTKSFFNVPLPITLEDPSEMALGGEEIWGQFINHLPSC